METQDGSEEGRRRRASPFMIYDSATVPPLSTVAMNFGGHPGTAEDEIHGVDEATLVDRLVETSATRDVLLKMLGRSAADTWLLLGEQRRVLAPQLPERSPGDFDIIAGPHRDGLIGLDELWAIEVKRRRVRSDGTPKSFPSGRGTTQARNACADGFDRVYLLHVLVREGFTASDDVAPWWHSVQSADLHRAMDMTERLVITGAEDWPFGYAMLGWGQLPGTDPRRAGGVTWRYVRDAPFRPLRVHSDTQRNRSLLRRGLESRVGERRPATGVLRSCQMCRRVFSPAQATTTRCC